MPLGFHNGYALALREERARALGLRTLSDLAKHPDLKMGLTQEFIGRADGWPGLKQAYRLPFEAPQGLDHGLAYEAIAAGRIDVMDIYTTDAKIERFKLVALEDDRKFFPRYDAVLLHRADVPKRFPEAWARLQKLEGRISEREMIRLNAAAELEGRSFSEAAALFDSKASPVRSEERRFLGTLFGPDFWRLTGQHLLLVFVSLAASVALGVPLGILSQKIPALSQLVLGTVGVIQTIPSLALFAFLIALMGAIGTAPALVALFLYALLPIVRGTHTGLESVSRGMRQAALALGLRPTERLKLVELPLALPSILAGIKTSAVINVGTATIAAFVGAGGYGERIVSGLALNDNAMMLAGAGAGGGAGGGTVASETSGASVAPTIDPVAKITAELAPVSACAAASRQTLARARASSAISSVAVTLVIGLPASKAPAGAHLRRALWRAGLRQSTAANGRAPCIRLNETRSISAIGTIGRTNDCGSSRRGFLSCPLRCRPPEHQDEVVGGHLEDFSQFEPHAFGKPGDIADVAHAPFRVLRLQAGVEHGVADRGMPAVALEGAIEEQPPVLAQMARGAGKQSLRHAPGRDVDDVGTKDCEQLAGRMAVERGHRPVGIGKIDPLRRADVGQGGGFAPGRDAFQVRRAEIARPPDDVGVLPGEIHHVLAGAAAGFQHVARPAGEKFFQHRPDRLVVAMERRRVEPAVRFGRPAIPAELGDMLHHETSPASL